MVMMNHIIKPPERAPAMTKYVSFLVIDGRDGDMILVNYDNKNIDGLPNIPTVEVKQFPDVGHIEALFADTWVKYIGTTTPEISIIDHMDLRTGCITNRMYICKLMDDKVPYIRSGRRAGFVLSDLLFRREFESVFNREQKTKIMGYLRGKSRRVNGYLSP